MELGLTFDDVLLVPKWSNVRSRNDIDFDEYLINPLDTTIPFIPANMDTVTERDMAIAINDEGGIGFLHRFMSIEQQVDQFNYVKDTGHRCGASIGVNDEDKKRAYELYDNGCRAILIDVAHGHTDYVQEMVRWVKKEFQDWGLKIIAGNVATADGVKSLKVAGADIVKVGIGPGAACTTRIMTGVGVPQFTAIQNCANQGVPIIADGGIKTPGDAVKALAAGADFVMMGKVFSQCVEAPGRTKEIDGKRYKMYRGMASASAQKDRHMLTIEEARKVVAEGKAGLVEVTGTVHDVVHQYMGGLRSAMSYVGALSLIQLHAFAEFMQVTQAGQIEGTPHGV